MKSLRNTTAKTEIKKILFSSSKAYSPTEIQNKIENLCDRATVYRVLKRLLEEGNIHKIINIDGVVKYAANNLQITEYNHVHFNCLGCNTLTCINEVVPTIKLPSNYVLKEINFTLSGFCPQCAEKITI